MKCNSSNKRTQRFIELAREENTVGFIFDGMDINGNNYHKEFALERIFQLPWKPNGHFEINGDEDGKFKFISK